MRKEFTLNSNEAMEKFTEKIEKANKKITKLNLTIPSITFEVLKKYFLKDEKTNIVYDCTDIAINYEIIKINGYNVISQINHEYENGNIIKMIDTTISIDKKYQTISCNCDHCHVNRIRKNTYLIMDENGNIKQIGKSCLNNYLDYDVSRYVEYLNFIDEIDDDIEKFNNGFTNDFLINCLEYLEICENVIKEYGYMSKSRALELELDSTAKIALHVFSCGRMHFSYHKEDRYKEMIRKYENMETMKISENVINAVNWIKNIDTSFNDYLHNLKVIVNNEYIREKEIGYVSSLLATYYKAMDKKVKIEKENETKKLSEYVGNIGDKNVIMSLTLTKIINIDSMYGMIHIHIFNDENGNVIVYKGSKFLLDDIPNNNNYDLPQIMKIKFSIKSHEEYNGNKQTIIQRPKIV